MQVDLYFIPQQGNPALYFFACRLIEKVYHKNHQIYVHLPHEDDVLLLDKLLWTYNDTSFMPHQNTHTETEALAPILLACGPKKTELHDILLNMHSEVPEFYHDFQRILEIIPPSAQTIAKEHRVFYEEKGYKVSTHGIKA